MTLRRRLDRIEKTKLLNWLTVDEIPTPVLEAIVRRAFHQGGHSEEEEKLYRKLKALDSQLGAKEL